MPSIADLFVNVGADVSGALRGLNTVHSAVQNAASSLTSTGSALSAAVTAPLVIAGGAVFKFGTDFEHAFTGVRKTVDDSTTNMADLQRGILDLSTTSAGGGKSAAELAGIAEIAGSMGIEGSDNILKFTKTVAGISVATGLAEADVAKDMAAFLVAVGLPISEIDRLGSTVVDLGNRTAATEGQINEFNLRLAGALSTVGSTPQEITAISATLGSLQINAEAGGTAISKFFTDMTSAAAGSGGKIQDNSQKVRELQDKITDLGGSLQAATERQQAFGRNTPQATVSATADAVARYKRELAEAQTDLKNVDSTQGKAVGSAEQFARVAGISTDAFKELVKTNPTEAFTRIIEGIARIREAEGPAAALGALADIGIDDSRMRDALLRLSAGHEALRKNVGLANAAWESNTAAQDEVAKAMEDTNNQFSLMTNQIKRVLVDGWFQLRPIVLEVATALRDNIVPALQSALTWFRDLTPDMKQNVLLWAGIAAAAGPALVILGGIVAAVAALVSPVGLVVIGLIALGAAMAAAWNTDWLGSRTRFLSLVDGVTEGIANIRKAWEDNDIGGRIGSIVDTFKGIAGRILSIAVTLWTFFITIADRAFREIGSFFETVLLPPLRAVGQWIGDHIGKPLLALIQFISDIAARLGIKGIGGVDFGDLIRKGELALQGASAGIAAGGPGTANSVVVNLNNPTVPDQTVAERFAAEVTKQVQDALIAAERSSVVPPTPGLAGVPF